MEIFLKKMVMDKAILCVVFLSGVVTACHLDPDISITSLKLEGLSGSCLQIPCNFTVKKGTNFTGDKQAVAVWIKTQSQFITTNSDFVIFNGSRETKENYPMEITGDLSQKNCTTVFNDLKTKYTERYFFRVEAGNFRSTASCDSINITVQDSPWSPTIKVSGEQTEEVTITCSAVTPCPGSPPELTWDLHQGTPSVIEANSDGTFTTKITLKGTPTASHKRYNLTCSAAYPVKGGKPKIAQTTITLNDTYTFSDETGSWVKWVPALCAVIVIALICVIVYIWRFKLRRPNSPPAQVQATDEVFVQEPVQNEDNLHYGDVSFNIRKPKPTSTQEETVYSQVNVSQSNNNSIRQAAEMADIYSEVKK